MTKYREILRLQSQGISQRTIAISLSCSRNTVSKVLKRAEELNVSWPLKKPFTDGELQELLFPKIKMPSKRKRPDCEYIHKEMAKSGVTLSLLWHEYCEACRLSNEAPLMYSQFCVILWGQVLQYHSFFKTFPLQSSMFQKSFKNFYFFLIKVFFAHQVVMIAYYD